MKKGGKIVKILCADERLVRCLETELACVGVTQTVVSHRDSLIDGLVMASLVMVDLDDHPWDTLAEVRAQSACPWVVWSRQEQAIPDVICLRRPFLLEEFIKVVQGCMGEGWLTSPLSVTVMALREGVLIVGGETVELTPYEWALYRCLSDHRGEIVPRETLRDVLDGAGGNTVDVYVCHLRAKLEKPLGVRLIETVRSRGYRMM